MEREIGEYEENIIEKDGFTHTQRHATHTYHTHTTGYVRQSVRLTEHRGVTGKYGSNL